MPSPGEHAARPGLGLTVGEQIFLDPAVLRLYGPALYREVLAHEVIHVLQNRLAARVGS